jgi:DNA repair protein RadC
MAAREAIRIRELRATYRNLATIEGETVDSPEALVRAFRSVVPEGELREHFVVLHLDTRNKVIDAEVVSVGIVNQALVHPREVFRAAILRSDTAIAIAHNHPSGVPTPSRDDYEVTRRLIEAGKILGIEVLDSVVVGSSATFWSMHQRGEMPSPGR